MAKQDYPPIFKPGIHVLTLQEIEAAAVTPFVGDVQRASNFQRFCLWIDKVRALGIRGILWINGSFVTSKPGPGDIDCIIWNPQIPNMPTDPAEVARIHTEAAILLDAGVAATQFGLDLYAGQFQDHPPDSQFQAQAYWKGVFGFQHDGVSAKGFVEMHL